jgi:hypothetical protein
MLLHTETTLDDILMLNAFEINRRHIQKEFAHMYLMIFMVIMI